MSLVKKPRASSCIAGSSRCRLCPVHSCVARGWRVACGRAIDTFPNIFVRESPRVLQRDTEKKYRKEEEDNSSVRRIGGNGLRPPSLSGRGSKATVCLFIDLLLSLSVWLSIKARRRPYVVKRKSEMKGNRSAPLRQIVAIEATRVQ